MSARVINVLTYADDVVLLALSWYAMQHLLDVLEAQTRYKYELQILAMHRRCDGYVYDDTITVLRGMELLATSERAVNRP